MNAEVRQTLIASLRNAANDSNQPTMLLTAAAELERLGGPHPAAPGCVSPEPMRFSYSLRPGGWAERSWFVHSVLCRRTIHTDEDVRFCALALAGEAGELCNLIKKAWRQEWGWPVHDIGRLRREIAKEMADVRIYLELLARTLRVDLYAATASKWDEVEPTFGEDIQRKLIGFENELRVRAEVSREQGAS